MGALRAKLGGRRKLSPTVCAHARQRSRTLRAELRARTVLVLASPTLHREPRHPPEFGGRKRNRASGGRRVRVSRHLKCYRVGIVAPWAMLLCRAYGDSPQECASETGVR